MNKRLCLTVILPLALLAGPTRADYPLMNIVADKVIEKYKTASCEELREMKAKPKSDQEKNVIEILQDDPKMRTAFIDKVAAPVVNKMFECRLIP